MKGESRAVVSVRVPPGSPHGRSPALIVEPAQDAASPLTLAAQQTGEGALEFLARAGVNYGVNATVEVAQPKDYFEHRLRRLQSWEERA